MDNRLPLDPADIYLVQSSKDGVPAYGIFTNRDIIVQILRSDEMTVMWSDTCKDPSEAKYVASLFFQENFTPVTVENVPDNTFYIGDHILMAEILRYACGKIPEGGDYEDTATHVSISTAKGALRVLFYRDCTTTIGKPTYYLLGWKSKKSLPSFTACNIKRDKIYDRYHSGFSTDLAQNLPNIGFYIILGCAAIILTTIVAGVAEGFKETASKN